jgi:hypothetical protein
MIYGPETRRYFQFSQDSLPPYHQYYLRKIVDLLRQERVPLTFLNIPQFSERKNVGVTERENWPATLQVDVPLVGIAPAELFTGLSDDQIRFMYYDEHMNVNGSEFFTRAVAPAILKIYAAQTENK